MSSLEKQLVDVKKFLGHHSSSVRRQAIEIVSGCSTDAQLHPFFTKLDIGQDLLRLIGDSDADIAYHSCASLVNLSSNPNFSLHLLSAAPFDAILNQLRLPHLAHQHKELLFKALVNLTQSPQAIGHLLQEETAVQGLHVLRLMHMLKEVKVEDHTQLRTYHYLPFVFVNVTQTQCGRELIMEPQRNLVQYLIRFMDYDFDYLSTEKKNTQTQSSEHSDAAVMVVGECYKIFHRGIWRTVRNCLWCLNDAPQQFIEKLQKAKQLKQKQEKMSAKQQQQQQQKQPSKNKKNTRKTQKHKSKKENEVVKDRDDNEDENEMDAEEKEAIKQMMHRHFKRVFLDDGVQHEWAKNDLVFEILNPLLGGFYEYPKKLRTKLLKKQQECNAVDDARMTKLLKRMACDKLRFDDEDIRKIALECLHLLAAVDDEYDLHLMLPPVLNELCLRALLKEYESWEHSADLIKTSTGIRAALKHQMQQQTDKTGELQDVDDTDDIKHSDEVEESAHQEDNAKKQTSNDETATNEDDDVDEESRFKVEPMVQQYHSVETKAKKTLNEQQSTDFFDLVMKHSDK